MWVLGEMNLPADDHNEFVKSLANGADVL